MDNNNVIYDERRDGLVAFYNRIYAIMGLGVATSAIVAYITIAFFTSAVYSLISNSWSFLVIWLLAIFMMVPIQRAAARNSSTALPLFFAFAAVFGFLLSITISFYTTSNVAVAFVTASAMFFGMSVVGRVTKRDLSGMAKALWAGLIGIIVATLVNVFFIHSYGMTYIISLIGVAVFAGFIAWDNQKIKRVYEANNGQVQEGWAVSMALALYLDFVNLFLFLLQIFGGGGSRR